MKTLLALLALSVGPASHAADYTGCRTQLLGVADAYAAYMSSQSADCVAEMNKPGATRSRLSIIAKCSNALGQLQPIKSKSETACNACSSIDAKIAQACQDDGAQTFIDRVKAL